MSNLKAMKMAVPAILVLIFLMTGCSSGEGPGDAGVRDAGPACKQVDPPPFTPDPAQKKFALSMFHFNEQYVAGGLDTVMKDGTRVVFGGLENFKGWTERKLDDWYITQTFEPTLDMYLRHPSWKADIEFQGYLLELIAAKYPAVLEKLRIGAATGQLELVSIHYSDQLFVAFPRADLQKSVDLTKDIFGWNCVPLSPVVFNQEGEDGEGKHAFMAQNGYTTDVYPTNLFLYYHQGLSRAPWYHSRGVDVVVGPGDGYRSDLPFVFEKFEPSGIEVTWTFYDDGDLMAFPPDPYFAPFANKDDIAANIAAYERKLMDLESKGYKITSVGDFTAHLRAQGVEKPPLPPVIDGSWQPIDTQSIWRWLGGRSLAPYASKECDNTVRSLNYRARTDCAAAQILLGELKKRGKADQAVESAMLTAWKELMLGEVTDATGITPWEGEFNYGIVHSDNAQAAAAKVVAAWQKASGWLHTKVDISAGTVEKVAAIPTPEPPILAQAPFDVTVDAPTRTTSLNWYEAGTDAYTIELAFGPSADPTGEDAPSCVVTLTLPRYEESFIYSPALLDDEVVSIPISTFSYQAPTAYLPLANGLVGLGNGWWVVKDARVVNIAATYPIGGDHVIRFVDATADPVSGDVWKFHVIKGDESAALEISRRINTAPVVYR
ncbi:MAG: hypothetical protein WC889_08125 [Myxococcota bacterium]|jgi:hypothetical protein